MTETSYPLSAPFTSADWLGGAPYFTGRRVAVEALFDYLKPGHTLERFLGDFPSASREHAVAVIAPRARHGIVVAARRERHIAGKCLEPLHAAGLLR